MLEETSFSWNWLFHEWSRYIRGIRDWDMNWLHIIKLCIVIIYTYILGSYRCTYITLDVYTWMQVWKNWGRLDFTRVWSYVLVTSSDRCDSEKFYDSRKDHYENWVFSPHHQKKCTTIKYCNKFNKIDFIWTFVAHCLIIVFEWVQNYLQHI